MALGRLSLLLALVVVCVLQATSAFVVPAASRQVGQSTFTLRSGACLTVEQPAVSSDRRGDLRMGGKVAKFGIFSLNSFYNNARIKQMAQYAYRKNTVNCSD